MRQVNQAELIWRLRYAIQRSSQDLRNRLAGKDRQKREMAESILAEVIAEGLKNYEILSAAPLPEGSNLFERAAYRLGGGSVPPMEG